VIASVTGILAARDGETFVVQTDGGVGYAVTVPLGTAERLPVVGSRVTLLTELVVKEDSWSLFGFDDAAERSVFRLLMGTSGVGPKLAIAILSALGAPRTVRSLREKDIAALASVSGIGRKKAERMILELGDRTGGVELAPTPAGQPRAPGVEDTTRALVNLGYPAAAADAAMRAVLAEQGPADAAALLKRALVWLSSQKKSV